MDREDFLARVRSSLEREAGDAVGEPGPHALPEPPASGEMLDRLVHELREVGGKVHRVGSRAAARETVLEILRQREAGPTNRRRVVRGDTALLSSLALDAELAAAGIEVTVCRLGEGTSEEQLREAAFDADAGITSVDAAVAETGTLALLARPGQGRSISLLPPLHVAVLDARDVVWELQALFEKTAGGGLPSALTLVTGPSRTGDIELVLTVGVHGPGELHLVVIDGE
jgi:L-lactate dehydrogenase complex protein LldG